MLRTVAVPVLPGVFPFELGVLSEVFGLARPDDPLLPAFDFALCAPEPGAIRTPSGFSINVDADLTRLDSADLVAVPAIRGDVGLPGDLAAALRRALDRGATVLSVCSGAFVLGEAGLLDGRRCTTHWLHAQELARRFPAAQVDPNVLYVDDRGVLTSAGTAAGIDACLYLVRKEFGERVANRLARRMVVPPHRDGGQQQYVEMPVPPIEADTLHEMLDWMTSALAEPLTVEDLARRAHMSPRTFARRFRAETGTTPHHWLTAQRVLLAQRLLEDTQHGIEDIARRCGLGSAAALRHHFVRRVGTTPHDYRRTFRRRVA